MFSDMKFYQDYFVEIILCNNISNIIKYALDVYVFRMCIRNGPRILSENYTEKNNTLDATVHEGNQEELIDRIMESQLA